METKYKYFKLGDKPLDDQIFVFGSNLAGIHGRGAALQALEEFGAAWRVGIGFVGNSYAIPTKDARIKKLPIEIIELYIQEFIEFAKNNPDMQFYVTAIGTGLAGYTHSEIAPLFKGSPTNCTFDKRWRGYLE